MLEQPKPKTLQNNLRDGESKIKKNLQSNRK